MGREEDLYWYRTALAKGWIRRETLEEVAARAAGRDLGEVLLEEGFLSQRQYDQGLSRLRGPVPRGASPPSIGPYDILSEIGRGGSGVVYRVRHRETGRERALKAFDLSQAEGRDVERMRSEVRALLALEHPRLVRVHEFGEDGGRFYYAMDLVEGQALSERIALAAPFEPREAVRIAAELARTLAAVHERGFVHRDLKPSNVVLDATRGVPVLVDFGIARDAGGRLRESLEREVLGTPEYLAPEQVTGDASALRATTDVYALGAILYAMLTGRPPVEGASGVEIATRLRERRRPVPPSVHAPAVDGRLERIVLAALDPDPNRRTPTAGALAIDLERWAAGKPPLVGSTSAGRIGFARLARRARTPALWVLALAALAAAWFDRRADRLEDERELETLAGLLEEEAERAASRGERPRADALAGALEEATGSSERARALAARLDALGEPVVDGLLARANEHLAAGDALRAARTAEWALEVAPGRSEAREILERAARRLLRLELDPESGEGAGIEVLADDRSAVELRLLAAGPPSGWTHGGRRASIRVSGPGLIAYSFEVDLPASGEVSIAPAAFRAADLPPGWTLLAGIRRTPGRIEIVPERLVSIEAEAAEVARRRATRTGERTAEAADVAGWLADPRLVPVGPTLEPRGTHLWVPWGERARIPALGTAEVDRLASDEAIETLAREAGALLESARRALQETGGLAIPEEASARFRRAVEAFEAAAAVDPSRRDEARREWIEPGRALLALPGAFVSAAGAAAGRTVLLETADGTRRPARLVRVEHERTRIVFETASGPVALSPGELARPWIESLLAASPEPVLEAWRRLTGSEAAVDPDPPPMPRFERSLVPASGQWRPTALAAGPGGSWSAVGTAHGQLALVPSDPAAPIRLAPGHLGAIDLLAACASGRRLATAGRDRTTRIWSADGRLLASWFGSESPATSLEFDRDGRRLLVRYGESEIRIHEVDGGRVEERIDRPVAAASLAPSGDRIALALASGRIEILRRLDDRDPVTLVEGQGKLSALRYSPDGSRVAAGTRDGRLRVWEVEGRRLVHDSPEQPIRVLGLSWSPAGDRILVEGASGIFQEWDLGTGVRRLVADRLSRPIWGAGYDGKGHLVLGVSESGPVLEGVGEARALAAVRDAAIDGRAAVWADRAGRLHARLLPEGRPVPAPDAHPRGVSATALLPGSGRLVTGDAEGRVHVWQPPAPPGEPRVVEGPGGPILAVDASPDGRFVAAAGSAGKVGIWEAATGRPVRTLADHSGAVRDLVYGPRGRWLATAGEDATAFLWDAESGRRVHRLASHRGEVTCLAFGPAGDILYTGSLDATVRLWRVEDGRELEVWRGHTAPVAALAVSPDGSAVAVGLASGEVAFRKASGGEVTGLFKGSTLAPVRMAFHPDGRFLWRSAWDGSVRAIPISGGPFVLSLPGVAFDFDPLLHRVYLADKDGRLAWRRFGDWEGPAPIDGHYGPATDLAVSRDGGLVVTGGRDGIVRIWPGPAAGRKADLEGLDDAVVELVAPGSGERVVAATAGGRLRSWPAGGGPGLDVAGPRPGAILDVDVDGRGLVLAASAFEEGIVLVDLAEHRVYDRVGLDANVLSVAVRPDGREVAAGTADGRIVRYDLLAGRAVETIEAGRAPVRVLAYGREGRTIVAGVSGEPALRVRDVAGRRWIGEFGREVPTAAAGPNAFGTADGRLEMHR